MRTGRLIAVLGLLLAVQLLLTGWLWRQAAPVPAAPSAALLDFDSTQVDRIQIIDPEAHITLEKTGDDWVLPGSQGFPAGQFQVTRLLSDLAGLHPVLPVATSAEAARRFRVADDGFERRIRLWQGDRLLGDLYLGDAAGPRRVYGRVAGQQAIYTLTFNALEVGTRADAWTDKTWLQLDPAQITSLQLGDIQLHRDGDHWRLDGLSDDQHTDQAAAAQLVSRIANLSFMAVAGRADQAPPGKPLLDLSLTLADGSTLHYQFADPGKDGDPLLLVAGRGFVLRIGSYVFKPIAETRRADLAAADTPLPASPTAPPGAADAPSLPAPLSARPQDGQPDTPAALPGG